MAKTLFENVESDRLTIAAHRLAVYFSDDQDLPARYRKATDLAAKPRKVKEDALIEQRFKANVKSWTDLMETMLTRIDNEQAWRFLDLSPAIPSSVRKLTDCDDFRAFLDYLILRRDKEECCPDELGGICRLLGSFQRKIEERLQTV
jgi:hypothetical protein